MLTAADLDSSDAALPDVDPGTATAVASVFSRSASHKLELESIPDAMPGVIDRVSFFNRARTLQEALYCRPEPEAATGDVPAPGFVSLRVAEINSLSNSLR
jgi:hypothetical protein